MALDLQLFHASWKGGPHHLAERAWILCCVIDQTKSAQRGRIPSISVHSDESIQEARAWLPEEPECLLLVFYAVRYSSSTLLMFGILEAETPTSLFTLQELLRATNKALSTMTNMAKDSNEFSITVRTYERQASAWLERVQALRAELQKDGKLESSVDSYLSYLAEFYVSCEHFTQAANSSHDAAKAEIPSTRLESGSLVLCFPACSESLIYGLLAL
jgi:hypothetical protein